MACRQTSTVSATARCRSGNAVYDPSHAQKWPNATVPSGSSWMNVTIRATTHVLHRSTATTATSHRAAMAISGLTGNRNWNIHPSNARFVTSSESPTGADAYDSGPVSARTGRTGLAVAAVLTGAAADEAGIR